MYASTFFRIRSATQAESLEVRISYMFGSTSMSMYGCVGNTNTSSLFSYNETSHRWFKFDVQPSALGEVIHTHYSSDGNTWTDSGFSCTWTSSASPAIVEMGIEGYSGGTSGQFDNFNVKTCPP
jgi:hypothetical protein